MKSKHIFYLIMFLASIFWMESPFVQKAQAATLTVTTASDNGNNNFPTSGSLREAIIIANNTANSADTINFNIPAGNPGCNATTNVCTITPPTPLPVITTTILIDGYTQPGASLNSLSVGSNAVLRIELNGTNAGAGADGLTIDAIGSRVKGLIINRFSGSGIRLQKINQRVEGNFIGTDATGTIDLGNVAGITLVGANNSFIGSGGFTSRNLISGNGVAVHLLSGTGSVVKGNLIGTTANGVNPLGNSVGVRVSSTSSNNTIGAPFNGEGNVIAFNSGSGVVVIGNATGNTIRGNSIHDNQGISSGLGLGIDLGDDHITPNDALDTDAFTNNLQNFPDLMSAIVSGGSTVIQGRLNSTPGTTFNIDFYSNTACDLGYGEGQTYIGSTTATTSSRGTIAFSATLPVNATGQVITATATDSGNNTSEFSGCLAVGALTTFSVTTTADNGDNSIPIPGSLRAAIRESNLLGGLKMITFNIPASDANCNATTNVCAIALMPVSLPVISTPVVIDGWSQGGAGYSGRPLIELNSNLTINAGSSTVQGLINRGIVLQTFGGNTIRGNYIGTDASGLNRPANAIGNGILIQTPENVIGGTNAAARNLISGCNSNGILIRTIQAQGNIIQGNYIGTDINGANVSGVMGNIGNGIRIDVSASNNTIGGTASGAGNLIAFSGINGGAGIHVNNGTGNSIRGNSIRDNPNLGIDLLESVVTPNDLGDADTGANNLQNFPVISNASANAGSVTVSGTLNSLANQQFAIDFYSSPTCNGSGNGEGATYLGSTTVTTDNAGNTNFSSTFPIASGTQTVTATATSIPTGDTSEFSACRAIIAPTAATAPLGGQITGEFGQSVRGIVVKLIRASDGTVRESVTNTKGFYRFDDIVTGDIYIITPVRRGFEFSPDNIVYSHLEQRFDLNFNVVRQRSTINTVSGDD